MSLYYVQKLFYQLNRDAHTRERFEEDINALLDDYEFTNEEIEAIKQDDIGLLYIMGVNGQILMHYAAMRGYTWDEYLESMRASLREHGKVRAGLYATVWE